MSKLPKAFKRKEHETMRDFSAIPAGEYVVKITKSLYKANSNKNGHMLALTLTVQNKEHKGHNVFVNLNLDNPSEKAVEIANNELATIADALGKAVIKDTDELLNKILIAKLSIKNDQNEVAMYSPLPAGDEPDDEEEEEDSDEDETEEDEEESEVSADDVKELANKYKKLTNLKALKEVLGEYDIKKTSEIADMDEDDLESLMEDLEEAIEEAE